jgi:hypothetical protein
VAIPGIGRLDPEHWSGAEGHDSWLRSPELRNNDEIIVYTYAHGLYPEDLSVENIDQEGARLLSELEQLPTVSPSFDHLAHTR